jgi:hypothetical protein
VRRVRAGQRGRVSVTVLGPSTEAAGHCRQKCGLPVAADVSGVHTGIGRTDAGCAQAWKAVKHEGAVCRSGHAGSPGQVARDLRRYLEGGPRLWALRRHRRGSRRWTPGMPRASVGQRGHVGPGPAPPGCAATWPGTRSSRPWAMARAPSSALAIALPGGDWDGLGVPRLPRVSVAD